ncbi:MULTISPECIES: hypothetical protein [unclassified Enterococcus]|jgi:hypothetical protein|uniref:hypothetical protein n=1 Tax=unclassified Enterococcus TaxID=2608891 RepID=UPI003D296CEE
MVDYYLGVYEGLTQFQNLELFFTSLLIAAVSAVGFFFFLYIMLFCIGRLGSYWRIRSKGSYKQKSGLPKKPQAQTSSNKEFSNTANKRDMYLKNK